MEKPFIGLDEKEFHNSRDSPFYSLLGLLEEEVLGGPQSGLLGDELLEIQEETEEEKGSEIYAECNKGRIYQFMAVALKEVQSLLYVKHAIHGGRGERHRHG
jgi:hypothetical protein